jgi:hypothetical protein
LPDDVVAIARDLIAACRERSVDARVIGGVAIALRCPSATRPELSRSYNDLDFVVMRNATKGFEEACQACGFEGEKRFNALYGNSRLLYHRGSLDLDCFVQVFEQCHKLDFAGRFRPGEDTISLADIVLTKLQVVQINEKDLTDVVTVFLDYEPTRGGPFDLDAFLEVVRTDWGWYTTVSDNLVRVPEIAAQKLPPEDAAIVKKRVEALQKAMEAAPKTLAWKLRAKVGRRVQWYELPEEKPT